MKIPPNLTGFDGKALKGEVYLTSGNSGTPGNRTKLLEEGMKREGNHFTCYALTAEDDAIAPCFNMNSGVVEFVDVVVDGILRASHSNEGATKNFSKKFEWVVGQIKSSNRYVDRIYQLQIAKRNIEKTRNVKGGAPHSVGSIEIQIFRKDPNAHKNHTTDSDSDAFSSLSKEETPDLGNAERAPTFEDHTQWWNLNPCVDEDTIPSPPFEVGGIGYRKFQGNAKSLVVKKWPGDYKVWASFKFLLFSTADFHTLGFLDTPKYIGTPWNGTQETSRKPTVKDVSRPSKATSVIDPDDVGSDHDDDVVVDTVENVDKPAPETKTKIDEPTKIFKGKEVGRKSIKSSVSIEIEVPSQAVKSMKPVGKQTRVIEDSQSSEILDESHAEVNRTVSKSSRLSKVSQVIDLSGEDASEPTDTVVFAPAIKIEKDEFTGNDFDQGNGTDTNLRRKPLSMSGVEGAPASEAWNDPDRSLWYQRRGLSKILDDSLTLNDDKSQAEKDLNSSDNSKIISLDNPDSLNQPSVPCIVGKPAEKETVTHFKPLSTQVGGLSWEPLTPPVSSKKSGSNYFNHFGTERRVLFGDSNGTIQIESAARAIITEDNYSDNDSREASPLVKHDQRVPENKAKKLSRQYLGFTLETKTSNIEKPGQSSNVNNMETDFDEFIHTSPQPEDTEMVDAVEADPETELTAPRSPSPKAGPQSTITNQDQDSVDKTVPSQSQELNTSQNGQNDSEKSTQEIPESILEGIAEAQRLQRAKRFPSTAIPEVENEEALEFDRAEASPDTDITNSDNDKLLSEATKPNSKLNDAPFDIGNQKDGRQDSPAEADESTITVGTTKPAKQSKARAPAAAKPSPLKTASTPKTQPTSMSKTTTVQKPPAVKVEKSSNVSAQSEQSQAKPKKSTSKVESASIVSAQPAQSQAKPKKPSPKTTKAPSAPKTPKAPASVVPEEPVPKGKGKGRAKAGVNDKRKADQMTSASSNSGPNKTNISPALKQTSTAEGAIAIAEARKQAAIEKKQALEEKLNAIRVAKAERAEKEEADRINKEAQAFEDEVAELEKRIAMEQMDDE
ncbi:uncharacterized protein Bfra_008930 [Botrytis fragariae]|uniref:Uncharacterized protein n=1 Tax=Botrytis fragariae TaxID=1964551 RepID=A0A8H6EGW9_9HELO|nr:uncharacterized protein Bfra_008930 [Botrytis fragariae]KAF5871904.1 hypothetical protein Bfra_008930 [Botrytis fragariae]